MQTTDHEKTKTAVRNPSLPETSRGESDSKVEFEMFDPLELIKRVENSDLDPAAGMYVIDHLHQHPPPAEAVGEISGKRLLAILAFAVILIGAINLVCSLSIAWIVSLSLAETALIVGGAYLTMTLVAIWNFRSDRKEGSLNKLIQLLGQACMLNRRLSTFTIIIFLLFKSSVTNFGDLATSYKILLTYATGIAMTSIIAQAVFDVAITVFLLRKILSLRLWTPSQLRSLLFDLLLALHPMTPRDESFKASRLSNLKIKIFGLLFMRAVSRTCKIGLKTPIVTGCQRNMREQFEAIVNLCSVAPERAGKEIGLFILRLQKLFTAGDWSEFVEKNAVQDTARVQANWKPFVYYSFSTGLSIFLLFVNVNTKTLPIDQDTSWKVVTLYWLGELLSAIKPKDAKNAIDELVGKPK